MQLDDFLQTQGYDKVVLEKNSIGQLILAVRYDNYPLRFILDTGASTSILDISVAQERQLPLEPLSIFGGGVGTAQAAVFQLPTTNLELGEMTLTDRTLFAMDIAHVNQALADRQAERIDGVLGSDILNQHHAVIDCQHCCLYLLK